MVVTIHLARVMMRMGTVLVYSVDAATGKPKRTWFFFKFQNQTLGAAPSAFARLSELSR